MYEAIFRNSFKDTFPRIYQVRHTISEKISKYSNTKLGYLLNTINDFTTSPPIRSIEYLKATTHKLNILKKRLLHKKEKTE